MKDKNYIFKDIYDVLVKDGVNVNNMETIIKDYLDYLKNINNISLDFSDCEKVTTYKGKTIHKYTTDSGKDKNNDKGYTSSESLDNLKDKIDSFSLNDLTDRLNKINFSENDDLYEQFEITY